MEYGTYEVDEELNLATYADNHGNELILKCRFVNGVAYTSADDTVKLARWGIKYGNPNAYSLLEQVVKARMQYKTKK